MKLDLLTNATVVDDAIRFVSDRSKDKEKMESSDSNDKEESNEPDYDEDEDQLEEKQEEERKIYISISSRFPLAWYSPTPMWLTTLFYTKTTKK